MKQQQQLTRSSTPGLRTLILRGTLALLVLAQIHEALAARTPPNDPRKESNSHQVRRHVQSSLPTDDPLEEILVCHLVDGSFREDTMFAVAWWIEAFGGNPGREGACNDVCPCGPNSTCSDLTEASFQCTCNFGFVASDNITNNPRCEPQTNFGSCNVDGPPCGAGLTCLDGICLPLCDGYQCPHDLLECVDDPRDDCNPLLIQAQPCGGICLVRDDSLPDSFCDVNDNDSCVEPTTTCVRKGFPCTGTVNETCAGVCEPVCGDSSDCLEDEELCFGEGYCDMVPDSCGGPFRVNCPMGYGCAANPDSPCELGSDPGCYGVCAVSCLMGSDSISPCPNGTVCVDDPFDECYPIFEDSCSGSCFVTGPCDDPLGVACPYGTVCSEDPECDPLMSNCTKVCLDDMLPLYCGNFTGAQVDCPLDQYCSLLDCGPEGCYGTCRDPPTCNAFLDERQCPLGYECMDDPFQSCSISNNETECLGRCTKLCGGNFTDALCAEGSTCTDPSFECPLGHDCSPFCEMFAPCGVEGGLISCPRDTVCIAGTCRDLDTTVACDNTSPCFAGFRCVADVESTCFFDGSPSCQGICLPECGGPTNESCPVDSLFCLDDPYDDCDPVNGGLGCFGACHELPTLEMPCAGPESLPCPVAFTCILEEGCFGPECTGLCQRACAGFAEFSCPEGTICRDDTRDFCNPFGGGFLCPGICVQGRSESLLRASASWNHDLNTFTVLIASVIVMITLLDGH